MEVTMCCPMSYTVAWSVHESIFWYSYRSRHNCFVNKLALTDAIRLTKRCIRTQIYDEGITDRHGSALFWCSRKFWKRLILKWFVGSVSKSFEMPLLQIVMFRYCAVYVIQNSWTDIVDNEYMISCLIKTCNFAPVMQMMIPNNKTAPAA